MMKLYTVIFCVSLLSDICLYGSKVLFSSEDAIAVSSHSDIILSVRFVDHAYFDNEIGGRSYRAEFAVNEVLKGAYDQPFIDINRNNANCGQLHSILGCGLSEYYTGNYLLFLEENVDYFNLVMGSRFDAPESKLLESAIQAFNPSFQLPNYLIASSSFTTYSKNYYYADSSRNYPCRWITGDKGEAIKYYLDVDVLPKNYANIDIILDLISQSFNAWEKKSHLKFQFAGFVSLGYSALNLDESTYADAIVIQLHDTYDALPYSTLGVARTYTAGYYDGINFGTAGKINGFIFDRIICSGIVINQDSNWGTGFGQNSLKSVLIHEIGHAVGLLHSNKNENGDVDLSLLYLQYPVLEPQFNSVMYSANKNIENLNSWDLDLIDLAYPQDDFAPFSYDRDVEIYANYHAHINSSSVNNFELSGRDLNSSSLETLIVGGGSIPGMALAIDGNRLRINQMWYYSSSDTDYVANGSWGGTILYALSDGENYSPIYTIEIKQILEDSNANGLSDTWERNHNIFGGNVSREGDYDGDGLSNYLEFILQTNPTTSLHTIEIANQGLFSQIDCSQVYEISTSLDAWHLFLQHKPNGAQSVDILNSDSFFIRKLD